ncbi:MAG: hypothetical protein DWQ31_02620 [Planctomycetota bacterium]|nr:MAG: hypothetical protein DWQ31_02620 [Planctomycetota bacterium]REJ95762.1 MAG: hypothetical protein DWQ35_05775 [Planctomycetota bacterium]REK30281.1 MAG: hypothetical protein DWQ42_02615 [Planctomycetota bacterium]REK43472.1 MAG: hypothetical protein DWQ46_11215 [Planctomycetota bacterium]
MGFLKKFFRDVFREEMGPHATSTFESLSDEDLEAHMNIARYGDFLLSDAVRPSYNLEVVPRSGFRHDVFHDENTKVSVPVLMVSHTTEKLFELFIDLLDPLGQNVDVVLETSHSRHDHGHTDLYREHIDMPVLKSTLYDYEEMLLNDGCCGVAVLNPGVPLEVQFDEHKLLICYGSDLTAFEEVLIDHGLPCDDEMKFITEAEHVHSSSDHFCEEFQELRTRLGMDGSFA